MKWRVDRPWQLVKICHGTLGRLRPKILTHLCVGQGLHCSTEGPIWLPSSTQTFFFGIKCSSGWWFGIYNPNWLLFFRGVQTTNQSCMGGVAWPCLITRGQQVAHFGAGFWSAVAWWTLAGVDIGFAEDATMTYNDIMASLLGNRMVERNSFSHLPESQIAKLNPGLFDLFILGLGI